jgi:hypothetical protein
VDTESRTAMRTHEVLLRSLLGHLRGAIESSPETVALARRN